jgi:pimeloyl-ACP methyl ester carboxylesterase
MPRQKLQKGTAVLVHAAWFDGSSWNKVAEQLHEQGFNVLSAQIPLTSFSDDVAAVKRILARQTGPVVLVGHSYGGAVITAAGSDEVKVKGLVYIASIVPDVGETVGQVFQRVAPHPQAPQLEPDADGFLWLTEEAFVNAVAPDSSPKEAALMAAAQKPINMKCLGEPLTKAAWREKPTWFLVAEMDRMVSPDTQRFLAQRMGSKLSSLPVDHVPLASHADALVKLISEAVTSVAAVAA